MTTTLTQHIWLDDRGIAWIDETNRKVLEVALDNLSHGWSAEEIHVQHRDLSLAQIHAALSYYHDHRTEIDEQVQSRMRAADHLREELGPTPFERRIAAKPPRAG
jgi:uncharacterized protein (DUF433 family)